MKSHIIRTTLLALSLALALPIAHAQSVGSAFTYQGELRAAGAPANSAFDFQFRLFNAASGGSAVGTTVTITSVGVVNGVFTVPLDFGPAQFAGDAQWLEISVRPATGGAFETLVPRTAMTPTPYALGAVAALANSVTSTSIVDGTIQFSDVLAMQFQARVTGTCSGNQGVQSIAANGTVVCGTFSGGGGTITGVTAGTGLTGGGTSGSVAVSIAASGVGSAQINPVQVQARVTGNCPSGQYVRVVNQDGTVTCGTDASGTGSVTSIATGTGLTGGPITATGTISVAAGGIGTTEINAAQVQRRVTGNCPSGQYVRVVNQDGTVTCGTDASGTSGWGLTGNAGTDPATNFIGTTDAQAFVVRTRNAQSLRIEPSDVLFNGSPVSANVIAGSNANAVAATVNGVRGATISGGGLPTGFNDPFELAGAPNLVTDNFGTVGGGTGNRAGNANNLGNDEPYAAIGGGQLNVASARLSTISGGGSNVATGQSAVIAGGESNSASGVWSSIAGGTNNSARGNTSVVAGGSFNAAAGVASAIGGGFLNCAGGDQSWAGGRGAGIRPSTDPNRQCAIPVTDSGDADGDEGTFLWADSQGSGISSTGPNRFIVRAQGGIWFGTDSAPAIPAGRFINTSTGAHLTTGGTWTNASSRALKTAFEAVDMAEVLARVLTLPLSRWQYRDSPAEGVHLGPVAEDFHAAFGLGADGRAISTVDADGIALAAIQGLNAKLETENSALRADLAALREEVRALAAMRAR